MKITQTSTTKKDGKPWYREPWPWLLMAGPGIVIIAGIYTAWLAVTSSDGLVAEDYYKQGQAAGQTLARSRHADALALQAGIRLTVDGLQVRLIGNDKLVPPPALTVTLSHPTRAGLDQQSRLRQDGDGYAGAMHLPASGHWLILLEDEARTWRLMGSVVLPAAGETLIGGDSAASS